MKKSLITLIGFALTLSACQSQAPTQSLAQVPANNPQLAAQLSASQSLAASRPTPAKSTTPALSRPTANALPTTPVPLKTSSPSTATTSASVTPLVPSPIASAAPIVSATTTEVQISANYNTETLVAGLHFNQDRAAAEAIAKKYNLKIERFIDSIKTVVFMTQGQNVTELIKLLSKEPALEYVETDQVATQKPENEKAVTSGFGLKAQLTTSDTHFGKQYGMQAMQIPESWALATGKNQVVAVIDTGVETTHPDLKGNLVDGYDAYSQKTGPNAGDVSSLNYIMASYKHGTHVAGVISALTNNGKGIAGVAPDSKVMPIKIFPDLADVIKAIVSPSEDESATIVSILADGIVWSADHGATVINMSLAVREESNTLTRAVQYALNKNISVVVAAGNDRHVDNARNYLASIPGVIGVGATDSQNKVTFFSNSGDYLSVAAPGLDIISSVPSFLGINSYVNMSGTSMAAPQVAGIAALLKDKYGAQATPAWIKQRLESTATDQGDTGRDDLYGYGLVNAWRALGGE